MIATRVPALYEPDPSLPDSLGFGLPAVEVLWAAARGTFILAVIAAPTALALRSEFFRTTAGKVLGAVAVLVALLPGSLRSPATLAADFLPTVLLVAWLAASAALLLRDHAAAWVLLGIFTVGGREVLALLAQPAAVDRAAGWMSAIVLAAAAAALLAGRRGARRRTSVPRPPPVAERATPPTSPWSGSA